MDIIFRCDLEGHPPRRKPPLLFIVNQAINQTPMVKVYEEKRRREEKASKLKLKYFQIKEIDIGRTRWGYLLPDDLETRLIAAKAFEWSSSSGSTYWVNDHCYNSRELRFWIGSAQIECAYGHQWHFDIEQVLDAAHDAFMSGHEVVMLNQPLNPAKLRKTVTGNREPEFLVSALKQWASVEAARWTLAKAESIPGFIAKTFPEYLAELHPEVLTKPAY